MAHHVRHSSVGPPQHIMPAPMHSDDGIQTRPMSLKVHYTFDREAQNRCLARWPHTLQIRSMPLNERMTIGVVDLRTCLQAIADCSPEIVCQHDLDYTVYASDYSEPDEPLVGQGMLSWGLMPDSDPHSQKLLTGRVTRNMLALFGGGGGSETLEVKLKLTAVPRIQRPEATGFPPMSALQHHSLPADTVLEWASFTQSNPTLGHKVNTTGALPSPVPAPQQLSSFPLPDNRPMDLRSQSAAPISPAMSIAMPIPGQPIVAQEAPQTTTASKAKRAAPAAKTSRPSSRSSSRNPTGRPRGRPRKNAKDAGSTSAAEEVTDADDGPQKKRVKTTQVDRASSTPFNALPESLRVAASASGSLRMLRPTGSGMDGSGASHVQEVPRAPTPVPDALPVQAKSKRKALAPSRWEPLAQYELQRPSTASFPDSGFQGSQPQDARSPTESLGQSPYPNYTPSDSPVDINSSPPVPRTTPFPQSSPSPSSPALPPMPHPVQPDSGFMSAELHDLLFDEEMIQDETFQELTQDFAPQAAPTGSIKAPKGRAGCATKRKSSEKPKQPEAFAFHEENPGDPELLPKQSLYNPPVVRQNKPPAPRNASKRQLQRSNTEPIPITSEAPQPSEAAQRPEEALPQVSIAKPEPPPSLPDLSEVPEVDVAPTLPTDANDDLPVAEPAPTRQVTAAPVPVATDRASSLPMPARPENANPPALQQTESSSSASTVPTVPASDPPAHSVPATMPPPNLQSEEMLYLNESEMPSKNLAKRQSIKDKLVEAIQKGEMPSFCVNCGAIETPTWRKIWTQEQEGQPPVGVELSEKPGHVTAIEILAAGDDEKGPKFRLIKKALGGSDIRGNWSEQQLCNPCGIWLCKFKSHRPPERWEKDAARLGQTRKKRDPAKANGSRAKKPRTKSDGQMAPTSEAYFMTDPVGPSERDTIENADEGVNSGSFNEQGSGGQSQDSNAVNGSPRGRGMGSTHSRGSGTAESPIAVEEDMGSTRRLLFPSPRKDGVPKVLGELAVNIVKTHTHTNYPDATELLGQKEKAKDSMGPPKTPHLADDVELEQELFGTPPARPSTPPPRTGSSAVFKTPTRATPSHRPITRSISKSIRSVRSIPRSPGQALLQLQRTPSKTPSSGSRRRTPGRNLHAHFALVDEEHMPFESPFTATLTQLLSEANEFTAGSPAHGLADLELGVHDSHGLAAADSLDFGSFLSTDMIMPSSPPMSKSGSAGHHVSFDAELSFHSAPDMWTQLESQSDLAGDGQDHGGML